MAMVQGQDAGVVAHQLSDGVTEYDLTFPAGPGDGPADLAARLGAALRAHDAVLVRAHAFGDLALAGPLRAAVAEAVPGEYGPMSYAEGRGCDENPLAGLQAVALAGPAIEWIELDGERLGARFEDELARYVLLGNVTATDRSVAPGVQCTATFERLEAALRSVGFEFSDVVRTWLFADRILDWYDDLNRSRTGFFTTRDIFNQLVPASTGTGLANDRGAALAASAVAVQAKHSHVHAQPVVSPLQNPALEYGSAFSRAVELQVGPLRRVLVSGTASIAKQGATVFLGRVEAQVEQTMAVVHGILAGRGLGWEHVCRAIAYNVTPDAAPAYEAYCAQHNLPAFPTIMVRGDLCRDDLLFEIELDAVVVD